MLTGGSRDRRLPTPRKSADIALFFSVYVHCELDARGECDVRIGTRDADRARFERLAQRIEDGALELGKLVEEQDANILR